MNKDRDNQSQEPEDQDKKALSRRQFFKQGTAAGIGSAALAGSGVLLAGTGSAQAQESRPRITWDYEADVVVLGGGAAGLMCAIRARDLGVSVLVVDQNFDFGGKMLHSGGQTSLGAGDPLQLRDIEGRSDKEGFITVARRHTVEELTDNADLLFKELTDWSVLEPGGQAPYRYNERELMRAHADNCSATRQQLLDNYVRYGRILGSNPNSGITRARQAAPFLKLGAKTDIKAGTISREDAGTADVSASHFSPRAMSDMSAVAAPGTVGEGAALARPLEFSAREKGIRFMPNRHMDELIREQPFSGKILGVRASYSPRIDPDTGKRLESLWQNGNIDERRETITIRAIKGVMLSTGGHGNNPQFRSMFYPAMREPAFPSSTWAVLGPRGQDASGIIAGMKVGATLAGMQGNLSTSITFHIPTRLATRDAYSNELPGHPTFVFRKSTGITLGVNSFEHLIAVNQVGKRFFNDIDLVKRVLLSSFPSGPLFGTPHAGVNHRPLDWRNSRPEWVKQMYSRHPGVDAALAMNEGSKAPDYYSGPLWAIFDAAAIERTGWDIKPPFTADNGYFFSADTVKELAEKIYKRHEFQRVPLTYLEATVAKWNTAVDAGMDEEFERGKDAPMHKINKPPFYAASLMVVWHDSYGGLRINGKAQIVDFEGKIIPGLYAAGEVTGGSTQHGLTGALVRGFIAGSNITKPA